MEITNVFVNDRSGEVTVNAVLEDVVLVHPQTLVDPPEYGPAVCVTSFFKEDVDFDVYNRDDLKDYLENADWEVLRDIDTDFDYE
jgi:hypothetical protein